MLIIPVEKRGKYAKDTTLRFCCFDPTSRMVYLSDKRSKKMCWKHRMRVYAVVPCCMSTSPEMNYRQHDFDAKDLLSVTIFGVSGSRLDSDDPETQSELQRLPKLLSESMNEFESTSGSVVGGQEVSSVSEASVSNIDEGSFFGKDQDSWLLKCFHYRSMESLVALILDALVADGLRYPVLGGIRNGRDPRNGLRLASIPLYLQVAFRRLLGTIVYTCLHGILCGLTSRGSVRIMAPHVYLCITDEELLFVAENGAVKRLLPLTSLEAIEYSGPPVNSAAPAGSNNPCASSFLSQYMPFAAFLTRGNPADVLFALSNPFMDENGDCSPSLAKVMPQLSAGKEMGNVLQVVRTLSATMRSGTGPANNANGSGAERSGGNARSSVHCVNDPFADDASPNSGTTPPNSSSVNVVTLPFDQGLGDYIKLFRQKHGRAFKWTTLSGGQELVPKASIAAEVAKSCDMRTPARHSLTQRPEFLSFYYGSELLAKEAQEESGEAQ
ncbi:hypothetical protein LSCM1_01559 [Leishmania martiniquensis]|uniref:Uncharacterized protein n=1 Tax=Leishmania martiniquensis TaxID=1580590 RepID=A0A836KI14_9TRYP|nr:hypothetical protein LSCM1_01559 [Leishmania martiniquensis]